MLTKELLYELLLMVGPTIQILIFLYIVWKLDLKKYYIIFFKIIPFYKKLEKDYNAKYPTVMNDIYVLQSFNIDKRDNLETFFFVSDSSFHIVSRTRPDLHVEIPFKSVIWQACCMKIYSKYNYGYYIDITFKTGRKKENLRFYTLDYNHKIDKKYGTYLSDEELYSFITKNFKEEDL